MLSIMHNDDAIDTSTGVAQKPEMITFYNLTKGSVDVMGEMSYSTGRISNRWPLVIIFSILNTAATNGRFLLLSTNKPEKNTEK